MYYKLDDEINKAINAILQSEQREKGRLGTKKIAVRDDYGNLIEFDMVIYSWLREMDNRREITRIEEDYPESTTISDIYKKHEVIARFLIDTYIDIDNSLEEFLSNHSLDVVVNLIDEILNNLN